MFNINAIQLILHAIVQHSNLTKNIYKTYGQKKTKKKNGCCRRKRKHQFVTTKCAEPYLLISVNCSNNQFIAVSVICL